MEITKDYLDSSLKDLAKTLATKTDLSDFKSDLKSDMKAMETRLIDRIDESQAELARMVTRGFEDLKKQLDVREEVEVLEQQMHEVRLKLNLA